MAYTRISIQFSDGDHDEYSKLNELIMDTYPTDDWAVDMDKCDDAERTMEFVVDDAAYAKQVLTGFANDHGRKVISFVEKPSSREEFDGINDD